MGSYLYVLVVAGWFGSVYFKALGLTEWILDVDLYGINYWIAKVICLMCLLISEFCS